MSQNNNLVIFAKQVDNVLFEIKQLLCDKNAKYGNSALEPLRIFSQSNIFEQLFVRIDDKLSRIKNHDIIEDNEDVLNDLIGYLVILIIAIQRNDEEYREWIQSLKDSVIKRELK